MNIVDNWMIDVLKGFGVFFLHPILYLFLFLTLAMGYNRVKKERKLFHVRIFDSVSETKLMLTAGLFAGLLISLITVGVGFVIPVGGIALIGVVTILLGLTFRLRFLSPAYVIGLSILLSMVLPHWSTGNTFIDLLINELTLIHPTTFSGLLAILLIVEGILIMKDGSRFSSPRLETSKRGRIVGAHVSNLLWMLPVFILLPGSPVSSVFPWWPLLSVGQQSFALCLLPFGIGFFQKTRGSLPKEAVRFTGKRVVALGIFIAILAVATYWVPVIAIAVALLAMLGRELLTIQQRVQDDDYTYFSRRDQGLVILGIIPKSPAEKMALQVGELITKVNGNQVKSVEEFYISLQKNRAFVKLEVVDQNGEPRLVQRALYDGEHHELGMLFVQDHKLANQELVG
ncbi:PDZ domain-containing protein [Bacillus sp. AK128]